MHDCLRSLLQTEVCLRPLLQITIGFSSCWEHSPGKDSRNHTNSATTNLESFCDHFGITPRHPCPQSGTLSNPRRLPLAPQPLKHDGDDRVAKSSEQKVFKVRTPTSYTPLRYVSAPAPQNASLDAAVLPDTFADQEVHHRLQVKYWNSKKQKHSC